MDATFASDLTVRLVAVSILLGQLEFALNASALSDQGWMSWAVGSLRRRWMNTTTTGPLLTAFLSDPIFKWIVRLNVALAAYAAIRGLSGAEGLYVVFLLFVGQLILTLRFPYGLEGADQMNLVITGAFAATLISSNPEYGEKLALWFVCIQSCLSYFTAGAAKLVSPIWRSGEAMRGVMATKIYGHENVSHLLSTFSGSAIIIAWAVILWEILFPAAFLSGGVVLYAFIFIGVVFHLTNAIVMGLNCFFWSFVACYPSVIWSSLQFKNWIGWA